MKTVFQFNNYKDYLRYLLHAKDSPRGLQSRLSKHLGCQSAYIYQVLKGKGDLTEDQAYRVTTFLKFTPSERDYFLLLLRHAKASAPELKEFLANELKSKLVSELDLKNKADAEVAKSNLVWEYYLSNQLVSMIHVMTSSPRYQTIPAIAAKLKISEELVAEILQKLYSFSFVSYENKRWQYRGASIHFAKNTSYQLTLQLLRRSQALAALSKQNPLNTDSTHFSTLFTLDSEGYEELKQMVASFVEKAQKKIHAGGTDELYIMCLDLFLPLAM